MAQPRILVVDDDPDLQEALALWFDKRNCDVTFAANGEQGMSILRSGEPIDLVLTDLMMPEFKVIKILQPAGEPAPPAPLPPETVSLASEIRMASEGLLSLIQVIGLVEGVPPAAQTAVTAAQKLAEHIHECAAKPAFHQM